ncbi:MAG: hypothetical protein KAQ83_02300 [Nanoarchaeota archaeon]|nr:hypothetical protein [Nanoarchaeota archaeon]
MATFTISIPRELKQEFSEFPEINLTEYLKKRLIVRLEELKKFEILKNQRKI